MQYIKYIYKKYISKKPYTLAEILKYDPLNTLK